MIKYREGCYPVVFKALELVVKNNIRFIFQFYHLIRFLNNLIVLKRQYYYIKSQLCCLLICSLTVRSDRESNTVC